MDKRVLKLEKELESLLNEEKKYDFIKDFKCQTEDEFERFKRNNITSFEKFKSIKERIRKIKWELMSPKDRKEREEYLKKLKDKFKDDNE